MVKFTKIPQQVLNVTTGKYSGAKPKSRPVDIGMDTNEFHKQVIGLAEKKIPIEKAHKAIDSHPDIQDKVRARSMADAVYKIMGSK